MAMLALLAGLADANRDIKKKQKRSKLQDQQRLEQEVSTKTDAPVELGKQEEDLSTKTDAPTEKVQEKAEDTNKDPNKKIDFQGTLENAQEVAKSVEQLKERTKETSQKAQQVSNKFDSYGKKVKALETNLDTLTEEQHKYNVAVTSHIKEGEQERMEAFNEATEDSDNQVSKNSEDEKVEATTTEKPEE